MIWYLFPGYSECVGVCCCAFKVFWCVLLCVQSVLARLCYVSSVVWCARFAVEPLCFISVFHFIQGVLVCVFTVYP